MSAHAGHSHGSNAGGRRMSTIRITVSILENDGRPARPNWRMPRCTSRAASSVA